MATTIQVFLMVYRSGDHIDNSSSSNTNSLSSGIGNATTAPTLSRRRSI